MGDLSIDKQSPLTNTAEEHGLTSPPVEPVAIIGLSCRYPGDATSPRKLWNFLKSGRSAWSKGPGERYNMSAFQDVKNIHGSTTNAQGGHFLSQDIGAFDAAFFGIHAAEASAMDPQQRLMLEVAYEAFENSGLTDGHLWGSNSGVYVGQWTSDYSEVLSRDTDYPATYHTTGTGPAITSNRISYQFNLQGPSMTVDTGCSSSFVALHLAIQSLRLGESEMAFVGGVNLLVDPQRFAYQSKLKMFSNEGKSFAFDHRANGYGRGEGVAGIVIKPLSAALRDGDRIRAVIRNCVLNQDGKTPGISVPSGPAQERAIIKAYAEAGLGLGADYIEAHGTGTAVGDPIEVGAIAATLSTSRKTNGKVPIGSIKGNVGHTESAAGLAGLVKAVLMLENKQIPPQVNYEKPNPKILLDEWNMTVPMELEHRELKRISVNSFGYGGTNAHVIVDAFEEKHGMNGHLEATSTTSKPLVFLLSAASEKSAQSLASNIAAYISDTTIDDEWLHNLAYTLNRRSRYKHSTSIVANSAETLTAKLLKLSEGPVAERNHGKKNRIAFIFSGQGAQYYNMGRELLNEAWPDFVGALERANKHLKTLGCYWDVFEELKKDSSESLVNEPGLGQPLSTTIQLALVETLRALKITPNSVAGHSSGEIAAAYCAGLVTFEDAIKISYHRGRLTTELLQREPNLQGAMMAVGASSKTVDEYIANMGNDSTRVKIACYNSPSSVTISGDLPAIEILSARLEVDSIFNRILRTNGAAYHSSQMQRIEDEYAQALADIELPQESNSTEVIMISSLTGFELDETDMGPDYWVKNLVSPVLFEDALWDLLQSDDGTARVDIVLEVGPHSQLEAPVRQTIQALDVDTKEIKYLSTLKRKTDASESLMGCIGNLFLEGVAFDLNEANSGSKRHTRQLLVDVPSYAFDHEQIYWHESRLSKDYRHRKFRPHELLGNLSADVNILEPRWRRYLQLDQVPWLKNHVIQGQIVFPAAGYLALVFEAAKRHTLTENAEAQIKGYKLHKVNIGRALVLSADQKDHELCFVLRPEPRSARDSFSSWMEFRIFSVSSEQSWTEHCRGLVKVLLVPDQQSEDSLDVTSSEETFISSEANEIREQSRTTLNSRKFYSLSRDVGLEWRAPFDCASTLQVGPNTSVCTVTSPIKDETDNSEYIIHPATLDAALFHGLSSILVVERGFDSPAVPSFIQDLYISAQYTETQGSQLNTYSTQASGGIGSLTFDVVIGAVSGQREELLLRAEGVTVTKLPGDVSLGGSSRELSHSIQWTTYCENITPAKLNALASVHQAQPSSATHNRNLNARAASYIKAALNEVTLSEIPEGYRHQWYEWMFTHVKTTPESSIPDGNEVNISLFKEERDAVDIIGQNLAGIMRGQVEPLSLLSQNGLLSSLYSNERCKACYVQMAAYCTELVKQGPNMKVLEIGAGTGSASEAMLGSLCPSGRSKITKYDFTDISSSFFEAARERLSAYSSVVDYRVLDIELDVANQGFEEGSYDLVIACNVIHATKELSNTIKRARSLLRPGGVFMLMEITKEEIYYNLVFGSLPGWWAGYEDGRKTSPLISDDQWKNTLQAHGFKNTAATFKDQSDDMGGTISVFVATATEAKTHIMPFPVEVVYYKKKSMQTQQLIDSLSKELNSENVQSSELEAASESLTTTIFLPEVCEVLATNITHSGWEAFRRRLLSSKAVLLLSKGATRDVTNPTAGLLAGYARCIRIEHPNIRLVTLDFDQSTEANTYATIIDGLLRSPSFDLKRTSSEVENEFSEHNGQLYVPRATHNEEVERHIRGVSGTLAPEMATFVDNGRTLYAQTEIPGLLDTIRWIPEETEAVLHPDEIRVELRAASINFKDVLIAAGQLEGITEMRNDCSGIVTEVGSNMKSRFRVGDAVCCYYSRSYTNQPRVHGDCCAIIPKNLSFEEAASLPIVWATVYYSLVDQGRLKSGETVLIHSAAGAVGQAAIMLAQHLGAEVYATVSSQQKKKFLMETYGLAEDHIFSSRSTAFGRKIRQATSKGGVDVVLNSLGGDMFRESCNSVAPYGRFVEIGRKDFQDDMLMPTRFLLRNITFAYVDLALLIEDNKPLVKRLLQDVIYLMASGAVRPTSITTMPISDMETAFRQIQAGKHIGKVILTVEEGQQAKIIPRAPAAPQFKQDGVYLIVGGMGGLGKAIIRWMASLGARHIITASRSAHIDSEAGALIAEMEEQNVVLEMKKCDVTSLDDVRALVAGIGNASVLRGVIHSAMVIQDALFQDMTYQQWKSATLPKTDGSWNLHQVLPKSIDFFILMSSAVAVSGNPGQSNYAGACAYQDALAHYRHKQGLPAYSLNVGCVVNSGFVSENPEVAAALRRQGFGTITVAELLANLDYIVSTSHSRTGCQSSVGLIPTGNERGLRKGVWIDDAKFRHLRRNDGVKQESGGSGDVAESIVAAKTADDALQCICQAILQQLAKLFATSLKYLSEDRSLDDYGVDSLVAVELRNWIGAYLQANIPMLVLRKSGSIRELAGIVMKESRLVTIEA